MCFSVAGHSSVVVMLLDGNADYASSDSSGATSLHYAALNNFAVCRVFVMHCRSCYSG